MLGNTREIKTPASVSAPCKIRAGNVGAQGEVLTFYTERGFKPGLKLRGLQPFLLLLKEPHFKVKETHFL